MPDNVDLTLIMQMLERLQIGQREIQSKLDNLDDGLTVLTSTVLRLERDMVRVKAILGRS